MTENANDKVTANGSPSGIATTITVIAKSTKSIIMPPVDAGNLADAGWICIYSAQYLTTSTINMIMADTKPNFPIS